MHVCITSVSGGRKCVVLSAGNLEFLLAHALKAWAKTVSCHPCVGFATAEAEPGWHLYAVSARCESILGFDLNGRGHGVDDLGGTVNGFRLRSIK